MLTSILISEHNVHVHTLYGVPATVHAPTGAMNNAEPTFSYQVLFPPFIPFSPPPCAVVKIELQTCKLSLWCLHHQDPPQCVLSLALSPSLGLLLSFGSASLSLPSRGAREQKQARRLSGQTESRKKVLR